MALPISDIQVHHACNQATLSKAIENLSPMEKLFVLKKLDIELNANPETSIQWSFRRHIVSIMLVQEIANGTTNNNY